MSLKNYKALLFDCYGTLVNWEQGMMEHLAPLTSQPGAKSREDILKVLGGHENRLQVESPSDLYPTILKKAYLATATDLGLEASEADAEAFGNSVPSWPAFPDSPDALKRLHDRGLKLVILSNVNNASFVHTRQKLEKGFKLDAIYTAEDIGTWKPDLNNFHYAIKHIKESFGIEQSEILIVANSKLHDIKPGQALGMKGVWINRASAVMGVVDFADVEPDWEFATMKEFADHLDAQA